MEYTIYGIHSKKKLRQNPIYTSFGRANIGGWGGGLLEPTWGSLRQYVYNGRRDCLTKNHKHKYTRLK